MAQPSQPSDEFRQWRCGDPWMYPIPNPNPNKHWEKCHDIVQKFDEDMYKAWKGEVDNLLIFAGLFSALVTAFATQSYQWLQPSSDDQALQLLAQISMQLSQGLPGNTLSIPISPFTVTASSVRINIFWFLSLTLSMATVLIGILCMQWLREYGRDAARSHKDALAIRQMRYEGLIRWKVPSILSFLPLLLQLAFVLFFAGLLDLLWNLNRLVAIFVTIAVDLVFLVLVGTTVLPALQSHLTKDPYLHVGQCPYKSPQSWAFYRLSLGVVSLYRFCLRWFTKMLAALRKHSPEQIEEEAQEPITLSGLSHFGRTVDVHSDKDWNDYDIRWRFMRDATYIDPDTGEPSEPQDGEDIIHSLKWIDQHFSENLDAVYLVFYCLPELGNAQAAQLVGQLDAEVAYLPELLLPTDSRPSLYEGSQMPDLEIREHIYMVFFWLHRHIHPILHQSYLECSIRLMNVTSRSVPRLALRQSDEDLQGISLETVFQLFHSLKRVISNESTNQQQASDIWDFLKDLYLSFHHPGLHDHLCSLTFDIFEEFHLWVLSRNLPRDEYRRRIETCAVGLTRVFAVMSNNDMAVLRSRNFFIKLEWLVRDLNARNAELQNHSAILRGLNKRRWPDLIKKIFPVQRIEQPDPTASEFPFSHLSQAEIKFPEPLTRAIPASN